MCVCACACVCVHSGHMDINMLGVCASVMRQFAHTSTHTRFPECTRDCVSLVCSGTVCGRVGMFTCGSVGPCVRSLGASLCEQSTSLRGYT